MTLYNIVASTNEATVVAECPPNPYRADSYQSEADLERGFLKQLQDQGYDYIQLRTETSLVNNLRIQLEALNHISFTDGEWQQFYGEKIANAREGITEKTRKIQDDYVQILKRDDGTEINIYLIDKRNIHNNRLQVLNQYDAPGGKYAARYDVTILVNGFPMVHVELKRRGVAIREAFNQINRYNRESFWSDSGLFEYVHLFVISNGTHTKYYSNTTRQKHLDDQKPGAIPSGKKGSHSFEFTNYWADSANRVIPDLVDFTRTFFAKHTLLNILTRYCVFNAQDELLVMRPYQIAATERILTRIITSSNQRQTGSLEAGGYIWHTTGSGKTLTSFKTAQLATGIPGIEKVLFVVDRKDLDYQTMQEYDKFQKGAANGNTSTRMLQRQLEDPNARIIITTIQKLDLFIARNKQHDIYKKHVVLVFDECHRSQFGEMRQAIVKAFKNYHIFGFTGTPIFADNANVNSHAQVWTTEQAFGERLHTYTIVDAINDGNVLPFRVDYINTIKPKEGMIDAQVPAIDTERALQAPERLRIVVDYLLEHFDQKTKRSNTYLRGGKALNGFNAIFAVQSIPMAKLYYEEIQKQLVEKQKDLKIATIFSFSANEEDPLTGLIEESFDTNNLEKSSRDFLEDAIGDYNQMFGTTYDTSSDKFENYYKDLSRRVKNREVDLLIVVNMFLTGFDAVTLNTLWVDKNLRLHGLIQAFSRTNRILNSVKTFGNIVCFRDLSKATDDAIALFGNREAGGIVLIKTFEEYYRTGYEVNGKHQPPYVELVERLRAEFPLGQPIIGEAAHKDFVRLFGTVLKLQNILNSFDEFAGSQIITERDQQDYQSRYIDIYDEIRSSGQAEKAIINDDLVFEIELIKQVEVNIDYILMLVVKYQQSHFKDKEILTTIEKSINASLELRSKKDLIEGFIARVNLDTEVENDWSVYVNERKEVELQSITIEEKLHADRTHRYMTNALRDGEFRTTGVEFDKLLPPMDLFENVRELVKTRVIDKLRAYFEKFLGLG
ncbi:MAG: type I restriction endonuclease subunit R [Candidatus Dojkabacteria bacterium]